MKCNPIRWLWGLFPLAALAGVMFLGRMPELVQQDLRTRADNALSSQGFGWASTIFDGRDAQLVGNAADDSDQKRAAGIVRSTPGVRVVDDQTKLLDEEKTYTWQAMLRGGKLRLSGFAPTEKARTAIMGLAKATFPGHEIDDRMKLARGVPAKEDSWLGWIGYGFKQLAGLKSGQVDLEGANLGVEGEANDAGTYKSIRTALANNLPQGVRLKTEKVSAPVVKPYTWGAKFQGNQVQLTGHVPSERAREDVFAAAKKAFPKAVVVDGMQTAAGEPKDWTAAAVASLARLGTFEDGEASIKDNQLTLSGMAGNQSAADDARQALKSMAAFKTTDQIKVREPVAAVVNPYLTGITAAGGVVSLTGYVPSDSARLALIESVKARLPGQKIDDRLQIASGQPEGWLGCVQGGLLGLGRLGAGKVELNNASMDLAGSADNVRLPDAVAQEVRAAIGAQCNARINISLSAKAEAAAADARRSADQASEAAKLAAAADASKREAAAKAEASAKTLEVRKAAAVECQATLGKIAKDGTINFKRASADIEPSSFPTLTKLAQATNTCPGMLIEIEGHTDAEGAVERNQVLSERRAQSVVTYLGNAGVPSDRLIAIGYGQTKPIAPNDTPENRAVNRRIEFTVKPQ
jgi:OmpA-OmpF porin, OOP family